MNEAEWLSCADPQPMLEVLQANGHGSERKARLFAVACARKVWSWMTDERSRRALEVCEQYADGLAGLKALKAARRDAFAASKVRASASAGTAYPAASEHAAVVALLVCTDTRRKGWLEVACSTAGSANSLVFHGLGEAAGWADRAAQCHLLRDIFGNPVRPATVKAAWLTPIVTALAHTIYDEPAFDRLPVLADALEEAGCDDEDLLTHCRHERVHARGCWVLDALTGRE
jgi:hypothetical protein